MCMRSSSSTSPCRLSSLSVRYTVTRSIPASSLRAWRRICAASRCCLAVSTTLRMVRRWCVSRTPREVSAACNRPGASVSGRGIAYETRLQIAYAQNSAFASHCGKGKLAGGLVAATHLSFDAVGEFLDLVGLFDHIERKNVFVGLVHVGLEFLRQLQQFIGIALEFRLALLVRFLFHGLPHIGRNATIVVVANAGNGLPLR